MSRRPTTIQDDVYRRAGHIMVPYENKLYLWGGYMEEPFVGNYNYMSRSSIHYHPPDEIWIFDPLLDTWSRKICQGSIPASLSGACAAVIGDNMYLFGGFSQNEDLYYVSTNTSNKIWCLHLPTFTWSLLNPDGFKPIPCDKSACWVYRNRYYVFGGIGEQLPQYPSPPAKINFEPDVSQSRQTGWSDQLVYYDVDKNSWVWPKDSGCKPLPRAAHAASVIGSRAFIFGGRHKQKRLNDFYCLDMETHVWKDLTDASIIKPEGRSWHTLNAISSDKLVLYGGFSTHCQVLNDIWLYNCTSHSWSLIDWLKLNPRLWHQMAPTYPGEHIVVGGIINNLLDNNINKDHADDMVVLRFSPPTLFILALEYLSRTKNVPKSSWKCLPANVKTLLEFRTDNFHVHSIIANSRK